MFSSRARTAARRIEPTFSPAAPEARSAGRYSDGWAAGFGGGVMGAMPGHLAENLSSVTGAVELIASGVASLPASLQVDTPDGRTPAPPTAPAWRVLQRPCPGMSWPAMVANMVASLLLHGNALAYVAADGRGAPISLVPVDWRHVNVQAVRSGDGSTRLVYDLNVPSPEFELLGLPRRILASEALHIRARGNGIVGRSVIHRAASVISEALAIQEAAAALWRNGLRPSAAVTTDQVLDHASRTRLREGLADFTGSGNVGKILVLESNLKFAPITMTSVDAEMLDSRRLSIEEVARLFLLPSAMLQASGHSAPPPADLQAQFAVQALAPVVNLIEAEFDNAILPAGTHLQLDLGGLMRGSYAALVGAQSVALQAGALTPNDVRRSLGLPALPGGDDLRPAGQAPSFPADGKGVPSLAPKPGPGGVLPNIGTNENDGQG